MDSNILRNYKLQREVLANISPRIVGDIMLGVCQLNLTP